MLKKTITYVDYNDVKRTEDFYFNLSKAEVAEMELSTTGGLAQHLQRILAAHDQVALIREFKSLVLKTYGIKSPDGKRFIKNDQITEEFVQTEAYSMIFMELATNEEAAAAFVKGILPADIQ